jgi:hypothetical protein
MRMRDKILDIVTHSPGINGTCINLELQRRSWLRRWFDVESFPMLLFGPGIGSMYVHLNALEESGLLRSEWGVATEARRGYRPRHYYRIEPADVGGRP